MTAARWLLADTWTITRRELDRWLRQPSAVVIAWLFPVLVLLMFRGLFGGAMAVPGGDYLAFLVPGALAMTVLFGLETTVAAVSADARAGVTDRFRSLPMNVAAVVTGRAVADLLHSAVALAVLAGAGHLLGWRWHGDAAGAAAAAGVLLLLRFALLWVGIFLGLAVPGTQSLVAVQILVWPVAFASSVFVDPATMPGWLGAVSAWNPVSATASLVRDLAGGPRWAGAGGGPAAGPASVWWPLLVIGVFLPLAVRTYRRLDR